MDALEDTPRIQVLSVSDTGRRRRWTDDEKIRIVEESLRSEGTIAAVARRHEISRSMLYDWRYRHRLGLLGCGPRFTPLIPVDDCLILRQATPAVPSQPPTMTVEVDGRYRILIADGFDMDAAARLIKGLAVRG